ncbi:mitochondrial carrier domain-containing protein [Aspergillus falconensis]
MAETEAASTAREFMVGAAGGIAQVIIGASTHPLVRMQVQANKSAVQVARDIWRHEGALAFYKGTLPPLLGVGTCISIVYSTYHKVSASFKSHTDTPDQALTLTTAQTFLTGGLAGLANSLISGPTEHIRIRLLTQFSPSPSSSHRSGEIETQNPYNGVYSCIRHITAASGLTGLYRGQVPTMLREFRSYGVCCSNQRTQDSASETPKWNVASCGAMQADGLGSKQRYRGVKDVVSQTWRQDGARGFWRGVGMAMGRAVPVCAGTFVVVEMARGLM